MTRFGGIWQAYERRVQAYERRMKVVFRRMKDVFSRMAKSEHALHTPEHDRTRLPYASHTPVNGP